MSTPLLVFTPLLMDNVMRRLPLVLFAGLISPLLAHAQQAPRTPGIRFEQGLSWPELRAKARATNKHILMVLSTTSCKLCAAMEQRIYRQESVGGYLNENFVAVQVQMDTTPHDGADVKRWHDEARKIYQQYTVAIFPTFLFFSPKGKLVHRAQGSKNAEAFLALAAEALDPAKQYYTLLDNYQRAQKDFTAMPELARMARTLGDTATARQVAGEYITHLNGAELYAKENLEFIRTVTFGSSDPGFVLFHHHGARVDSILERPGVAQSVVDRIITREEILPSVVAAERGGPHPDWSTLAATITQKYGAEVADRVVLRAKVEWFRSQKNWPNYIANVVPMVERDFLRGQGIGVGFPAQVVNNFAWDVFLHSNDQALLAKALAWSDLAVKALPDPVIIDTYANLLYKLGRTQEALRWEELAVKLEAKNRGFATTLEKMKRGEPTWPQP